MAFDGNGNWVSAFSAVADKDAGYKILASRFDNIFIADITQGFDNCVTRDGQGIMQTNTNANNYRVINVANPTDDKDAVNLGTLNTKDALAVHLAGTETITGDKTFTGNVSFSDADVKENFVALGMPDYTSGVTISSNYEAPSNGYLRVQAYINGGIAYGYIDGIPVYQWFDDGNSRGTSFIPIAKGSIWTCSVGFEVQEFYPCVGG